EGARAKTSKVRRERIAKRLELIRQAVKECLLETQLGAKHIMLLVDKLKEAHRLIEAEHYEIRRLEQRLGHPAGEILKHAARVRADEKDAARTASRLLPAPAVQAAEAADTIRDARRKCQHALRDVVDPPVGKPCHCRPGAHHSYPRAHDQDDQQGHPHLALSRPAVWA